MRVEDGTTVMDKCERMKISEFDRVLLKDGTEASIVEVFGDGGFIADIDKDGDTYTEEIREEQILRVVKHEEERNDEDY